LSGSSAWVLPCGHTPPEGNSPRSCSSSASEGENNVIRCVDLVDTGRFLCGAAKALVGSAAHGNLGCASHGVLSGPAVGSSRRASQGGCFPRHVPAAGHEVRQDNT
jgi:hypothetical protein